MRQPTYLFEGGEQPEAVSFDWDGVVVDSVGPKLL